MRGDGNRRLTARLPPALAGARIEESRLPGSGLRLFLLNGDYPQHALDDAAVSALMEAPLYWVFCWAAGQVLASRLLAEPAWVAGRRVVDFGAGSGVVAIAAARAGAAEVIACDTDPDALAACAANADLNGVSLRLTGDFDAVRGPVDLVTAADVLYDRANLRWLDRLRARAATVLLADSRLRDFAHPAFRRLGRWQSRTWPDLDESGEFRGVSVYAAGSLPGGCQAALPRARW